MPGFTLLGTVPQTGPLLYWLLSKGVENLPAKLLEDPAGYLTRVGDLIVWQNATGQQVVAGLASVAESQGRIEAAVASVDAAQTALASGLGIVQGLSLATLGVSAFSAGAMLWRLQALDKRVQELSKRIGDIEDRLEATDKAVLQTSLTFLKNYESKGKEVDLHSALQNACLSANTYGNLMANEAQGQKRLPVLNYRGRRYVLSLMTELHCLIHRNHLSVAIERVKEEKARLALLTEATYSETLGKSPEIYLDPNLARDGVTLELLTNLFEQLHQASAVTSEIRGAAAMFEHLREPIFRNRQSILSRVWVPARKAKARCLNNLRYLIACVEDVQRVESTRLLMTAASGEENFSVLDLVNQIRTWCADMVKGPLESGDSTTFAYTI